MLFKNYVTHTWQLYTYVSTQQAYPSRYHSSKGNQATKPHTVSLSPSLRLKRLAQARQSRLGESPFA